MALYLTVNKMIVALITTLGNEFYLIFALQHAIMYRALGREEYLKIRFPLDTIPQKSINQVFLNNQILPCNGKTTDCKACAKDATKALR